MLGIPYNCDGKVELSVGITMYVQRHADVWRSAGDVAPRILNLCARWKWVVSFMLRPLYPRGKSLRYPLDRRPDGSQNRSRSGGEKKN